MRHLFATRNLKMEMGIWVVLATVATVIASVGGGVWRITNALQTNARELREEIRLSNARNDARIDGSDARIDGAIKLVNENAVAIAELRGMLAGHIGNQPPQR